MHHLWIIFAAAIGPVGAFVNDSLPLLGALAVGGAQPAIGAGWDNEADDDFPNTLLDDTQWDNLKCKGDNLVKAMQFNNFDAAKLFSPIFPTAESPWDNFDAIATWGWRQSTDPEDIFSNFLTDDEEHDGIEWPGLGLDAPLKEFGLHTKSGDDPNEDIKIIYVNHFDPNGGSIDGQTYKVGPKIYHATGAHYKFGIETSTGAVFSLSRLSPLEAAKKRNPQVQKEGLPDLQRASDLAWLSWTKYAKPNNHLKYFFNVAITNVATQQAIRRVLKTTNSAYGPWPGATFGADTEEGKVLLGSPNGRGHGYFLAQHKAALEGNVYISKIQVFHGETDPFIPNMLFHVEQPKPLTGSQMKKRTLRKNKNRFKL
ncbi:hypothetical protein N0V86_004529 [Didymella sp. IMI 355093]|nr:hypothetical protein N0V86_004529 [Didymella sp. IMI 355093]